MTEEKLLENLKKDYKKIQDKFNLPDFEKLNEDFNIEKIAESETDILIKEIGKYIAEKFSNYLRFIEAILHPINSPMFIFSVIKSLGESENKKLIEIYKKLSKNEINAINIDLNFSKEKEADFIRESYKTWQEIKESMSGVLETINKNWDNEFKINNNGYFG